jgi:predicted transcriptional regulator
MPTTAEKAHAVKSIATSIKLPAELKSQIDESARKAGISAHAFMVKTLTDAARRAQLREQFQQDALDALQQVEDAGLAYAFEDVKEYLAQRAAWRKGTAPEPTRPDLMPWTGAKRR